MTLEEFTIKTKTLEDFYGKDLNYTQADIWFDELKNYSAEKYEKAIRNICKTSQYKPTLVQMLEEIRKVKAQVLSQQKVKCNYCKGTGYILYNRTVNNHVYEYVCLCTCANADGLEYNGLQISDQEHRQPFYVAKAQDIFHDRINQKSNMSNEIQRDTKSLITDLSKQMSF